MRKKIISIIASYESGDSSIKAYFFKDPNLMEFKTPKRTFREIELAMDASNVAQDDQETIKKLYCEMTKFIFQLPERISNSVEFFTLLTAIEKSVVTVRADALSLIRSRIGGCGYGFDRILPVIECPAVAQVGDTIDVRGLMTAYDSDKPPFVRANGEDFVQINRGIATRKFVVPDQKEFVLAGTITMLNKSGVPKTRPFSKTILVIPCTN